MVNEPAHTPTPNGPPPIAIIVYLTAQGQVQVQVQGHAIGDKIFCLGLIELGKQTLEQFWARQQPSKILIPDIRLEKP